MDKGPAPGKLTFQRGRLTIKEVKIRTDVMKEINGVLERERRGGFILEGVV